MEPVFSWLHRQRQQWNGYYTSLSLSAVIINLNLRLQFCGEAGLSLLLILLAVKDEKIELGM